MNLPLVFAMIYSAESVREKNDATEAVGGRREVLAQAAMMADNFHAKANHARNFDERSKWGTRRARATALMTPEEHKQFLDAQTAKKSRRW